MPMEGRKRRELISGFVLVLRSWVKICKFSYTACNQPTRAMSYQLPTAAVFIFVSVALSVNPTGKFKLNTLIETRKAYSVVPFLSSDLFD